MGEAENRHTAERVFRAINERDVSLFHDQFHAHAVIDFPQSGSAGLRGSPGPHSHAVLAQPPNPLRPIRAVGCVGGFVLPPTPCNISRRDC
jgi:hypothetical protein